MDPIRKPTKNKRRKKQRNGDQLVDTVPQDSGVVENPQQENQSLKDKEDSMVQLMPAWMVKHLTNQGNNTMAARSEPERQNSSEQNDQISEATSSGAELPVYEMPWQTKYEALLKKVRREMAQTEQSWETKVQQMEERNTELAEKEQSLERKLKESEEEKSRLVKKEQNWETQVKQLQEENTELLEKEQTCEAKLEKLERELAEQQQSWETSLKQVEEEKKELEDLCRELKMKKQKKKGRFFGFRKLFKTEQAEFPLEEKACQAKCESLQETFREEIAENQQSLEVEKELEDLCLELKKKKKKSFFQKWFKTGRSNVET